jgi:hypothetical protein
MHVPVLLLPCAWCWEALRKAVRAGIITKAPPIPTNDPKIPATTPTQHHIRHTVDIFQSLSQGHIMLQSGKALGGQGASEA